MRAFVITTISGQEKRYAAESERDAVALHNTSGDFQWRRGRRVFVCNPEPIATIRETSPEPPTAPRVTDYMRALLGE